VGRVVGEITHEAMGSNGFGFDPVMFIPSEGQTFAQMTEDKKNSLSHRGQSSRLMCDLMRERWLA
jgi:XTP/dITP diphosphohydrolase